VVDTINNQEQNPDGPPCYRTQATRPLTPPYYDKGKTAIVQPACGGYRQYRYRTSRPKGRSSKKANPLPPIPQGTRGYP